MVAAVSEQEHTGEWDPNKAYSPEFDDSVLIAELMDIHKERFAEPQRWAIFVIDSADQRSDVGRAAERRNFMEEPDLAHHYSPYDAHSTFLYLVDTEKEKPAGCVRIVRPNGKLDGLKTLADLPEVWDVDEGLAAMTHNIDPGKTWDIATLVVEPGYRISPAESTLTFALYDACRKDGTIDTWTTILVEGYFKLFQKAGTPFKRILDLPTKVHMGDPSVPAVMHLSDLESTMKVTNPRSYAKRVLGENVEFDLVTL